jgi:hypothetical protein
MSRKGIRNKPKADNRRRVTGPKCSQCGKRRKGMKQHRNPFTDKMETMHEICSYVVYLKYKKREP